MSLDPWVPPGYRLCATHDCDGYQMTMGRPHAHLLGDERWLIEEDRTGSTRP
jgi:hypothetical protein